MGNQGRDVVLMRLRERHLNTHCEEYANCNVFDHFFTARRIFRHK
jgi:hypothetical protein